MPTGKGGAKSAFSNGFVYVTRLGYTNYCSAPTPEDFDQWMAWMKNAIAMALDLEGAGVGGWGSTSGFPKRSALHRGVLEPPKPAESEVRLSAWMVGLPWWQTLGEV